MKTQVKVLLSMRGFSMRGFLSRFLSVTVQEMEQALNNKAARAVLCALTLGLVVIYVVVIARISSPDGLPANSAIQFKNENHESISFLELDRMRRASENVLRLQGYLDYNLPRDFALARGELNQRGFAPKTLDVSYLREMGALKADSYFIELHFLRLWFDDHRKIVASGILELIPEAVIRVLLWEVVSSAKPVNLLAIYQTPWLEVMQKDSSQKDPVSDSVLDSVIGGHRRILERLLGQAGRANPMILTKWLAARLYMSLPESRPFKRREQILAWLSAASSEAASEYEKESMWPQKASQFAANFSAIENILGTRGLLGDKAPRVRFYQTDIASRASVDFKTDFLVATSCVVPTLEQIAGFNAKDFVWVQTCDEKPSFASARNAVEFARQNRHRRLVGVGLLELRAALERRWLDGRMKISELRELGGTNEPAYNFGRGKKAWRKDLELVQYRAPIDVIKFVRQ